MRTWSLTSTALSLEVLFPLAYCLDGGNSGHSVTPVSSQDTWHTIPQDYIRSTQTLISAIFLLYPVFSKKHFCFPCHATLGTWVFPFPHVVHAHKPSSFTISGLSPKGWKKKSFPATLYKIALTPGSSPSSLEFFITPVSMWQILFLFTTTYKNHYLVIWY